MTKDFSLSIFLRIFNRISALEGTHENNAILHNNGVYPQGLKFLLKVFGKEFEGEPFFK